MAPVDVRLCMGPYAAGNDGRMQRANRVLMTAAGTGGLVISINPDFDLMDPDGTVDGVVDSVYVEDNAASDLGAIVAFPTAVLWFFEGSSDDQFAGIELFDRVGKRTAQIDEDGGDHIAILRDWLISLNTSRAAAEEGGHWRRTAEVLVRLVDDLVGDADGLRDELSAAHVDLDIANARIEELEQLRDVLLAELVRMKGATSRKVVSAVARAIGVVLTALIAQGGATVIEDRLEQPRRVADVVVVQCDTAPPDQA